MTTQQIITALVELDENLSGIRSSYDEAPSSISDVPAIVHLPHEGQSEPLTFGHDDWQSTERIRVQILCSRALLPAADATARPFKDLYLAALRAEASQPQDEILGGAAAGIGPVSFRYGAMEYAGETFIGWELMIEFLVFE